MKIKYDSLCDLYFDSSGFSSLFNEANFNQLNSTTTFVNMYAMQKQTMKSWKYMTFYREIQYKTEKMFS